MAAVELSSGAARLERAVRRPPRRRTGPRRVALVGAGYVARFHAEALSTLPGVQLAAIHDQGSERAAELGSLWGAPAVPTIESLPALGIEVAHVLVPPDRHEPVARRLLELGIGVLIEKPLAIESGGARALADLAAELGLPLGAQHNAAHQPAFRRLLAHVGQGALGRVEHAQVTFAATLPQLESGDHGHWMFRRVENVLLEQGVHPCSVLHALLGPVSRATTTTGPARRLSTGASFHARWDVSARAERGTAQLHLSFDGELPRFTVQVLGSDGVAEADLLRDTFSWEGTTPWVAPWDHFLAGWRRGSQLRRQSRRGLLAYARHTLGVGGRSDPFFAGMRASIAEFHRRLDCGECPADGTVAAEVIEWCEAIWAGRQGVAIAARPAPPQPPPEAPPRTGEVVVLGGSGTIGREVAARLLRRGHPVTVTGRREVAPAALVEGPGGERLRFVSSRLSDRDSLARAIGGARMVVHLATGGGETWSEVERSMVRGSVAAAEAALEAGVERFVYVSSIAALYAPDARGGEIGDDHPLDPRPEARDLYSRGKVEAERVLERMHRERGLPLVVVRPGIVLGAGAPLQHPGLGYWVRDAHCVGWGRGAHPLPVVTTGDVADALVAILELDGDELHGRALNLCSRTPLGAAELVAAFARATGRPLRFHPRSLIASQAAELGKWLLKRLGGRRVPLPSYRDLAARELRATYRSETARELLGWRPVEEGEAFLREVLAPAASAEAGREPAPTVRRVAGAAGVRPLRLLHVSPDFVAAGPALRTVALANAFGDSLEHVVESLGGGRGAARALRAGGRLEVLPASPRAGTLRTARRMRELLAAQRPDLVLTYNWASIDMVLAAASAGFRGLIHHEDGFEVEEARRLKLRRIWARRLALPAARRVVVPSRTLEEIARRRWRVPAYRLVRIPNGVSTERFAAADGNPELRQELGIPPGATVVGSVGHLRPVKALERLVAAWSALRGAHLVIVGDGPDRQRLEAAAAATGRRGECHFAGHRDDPDPWYRLFDVFALSSSSEQLPMTLLEAMASHLPIVATAVGDVADALPAEQQELLVAPGSGAEVALAERLRSLLADESRRRRLGALNRRRVEEAYSFGAMARAYEEVYRTAMGPQAAARWASRREA